MSGATLGMHPASGRRSMRSRSSDWSVVDLDTDPTPGQVDTIRAWAFELDRDAKTLWNQSHLMRRTLELIAPPKWSGVAAEAFASTLTELVEAAKTTSNQHGEAAWAAKVWASTLAELQEQADTALRDAEHAHEDLLREQALVATLGPQHTALVAALAALEKAYKAAENAPPPAGTKVPAWSEVSASRRQVTATATELANARARFNDAQERLDEATAKAHRAKDEHHEEEQLFARSLDRTLHGAVTRAALPELSDGFVPALSALARYDASGMTSGGIVPASMAVPGPGASLQQIAKWLVSGAYSIAELTAACGGGEVMAAIALITVIGVGKGSSTGGSKSYSPEERVTRARLEMYYWTHNLDGSVKQHIGPAPSSAGKYFDEAAPTADEVEEIVKQKTRKGNNSGVREADTPEEVRDIYKEITRGSEPDDVSSYDGERRLLPDGTRIGLREDSKSGGLTIDIKTPRGSKLKVHLPKGWGK